MLALRRSATGRATALKSLSASHGVSWFAALVCLQRISISLPVLALRRVCAASASPPINPQLVAHKGKGEQRLARHQLPVVVDLALEAGAAGFTKGRERLEAAKCSLVSSVSFPKLHASARQC